MSLGAESFRSGSHVTIIIQTSLWLVWLPPERLIESGSYLEPRVPFLTYALDFSSYALNFSSYALDLASMYKPEGYSAWVSADCPLVEAWGWIILGRHSVSDEERAVSWTQPDLLPCADVGLVILDDDGLTPACQARWHRSLGVTRDDWSWRMYASGTVLERLRAR